MSLPTIPLNPQATLHPPAKPLSEIVIWHHPSDPYGPEIFPPAFAPLPLANPLLNHPWEHIAFHAANDGLGLLNLKYAIRLTIVNHPYLQGTVIRAGHLIHAVLRVAGRPVAIQRWVWRTDEPTAELLKLYGKSRGERRVGESAADVHAKLRRLLYGLPRGRSKTAESPQAIGWKGKARAQQKMAKQGRLARLPTLIEEEDEDEGCEEMFVGPPFVTAADYGGKNGVWVCTTGMGSDGLKGACELVQEGNKLSEGGKYTIEGFVWKVEEVVTWQ